MKIVFVSNYFTHHQKPFSEEINILTDGNYTFIETEKISEERISMGWNYIKKPSYVKYIYSDDLTKTSCIDLINNADVVIIGGVLNKLITPRLKKKKITIIYTERINKKGIPWIKLPLRMIKFFFKLTKYRNCYMLCASAYTAYDFALINSFISKTYKWGYFPEHKSYDINNLINSKQKTSILWVGRLISWKHPEYVVYVAEYLKNMGILFNIRIVGDGVLFDDIYKMIQEKKLENYVEMVGQVDSENVRSYMENSEIFLFTSDFNEGWGAVLNEAMNSGCATVASHAIGAVPFLIDNNVNGVIYKNENVDDICQKVLYLINNTDIRKNIGINAYKTINDVWNASIASKRLLQLIDELQKSGECDLFSYGPCSRAKIIRNNWFKNE